MPKLSQMTAATTKRVLLFGAPKTGKTLLAGKLASDFDLVWFDLENGHDTLFQLPPAYQERIDVIAIPDTRSYPIAIETCLKVIKGSQTAICIPHGKVSCPLCARDPQSAALFQTIHFSTLPASSIVVFDSLTQLTNSAISFITKGQPDDYKLNYDDWGNLGKLMDTFLSHVQQAGFHVICISHETEAEMEDGKNKLVPTAGTRNFSRNVAKYFDEVIYCEVKNRKHVFASSTTYSGNILTGSRAGAVLETQADASLVPIFKGIPASAAPASPPASQNTPSNQAANLNAALRAKLGVSK